MKKNILVFKRELKTEIAKIKREIHSFHLAAGGILRDERKMDFDAGRGPDGKTWKSLKLETIRRKSGQHQTQKMKRKGKISGLATVKAKASAHPSKPLIDQGILQGLEIQYVRGRGIIARPWKARREVVTLGGESIAGIHEKPYKGRPRRHHWGMNVKAQKRIIKGWNVLLSDFIRGVK